MRRVLLLGDSIRLGYQPAVVDALGEWTVAGPAENCRSSRDLAAGLGRWALDRLEAPTFVHVNAGLHDLRQSEETNWRPLVPLREYGEHLGSILARLVAHPFIGAPRTIVATTTPVDATRHNVAKASHRYLEDVIAYNAVLSAKAAQLALPVNDLFAAVAESPQDLLSPDGVHLTDAGYRRLGVRVAEAVRGAAATEGPARTRPVGDPSPPQRRRPMPQ